MRRTWLNLLGNQAVWLCAVAGAGRGLQWPALLAATLFVASQLSTSPLPRVELRLLVLALACAWLVDGAAAAAGVVRYAAAPLGWMPPPWIHALWASFAMTINASMAFLQRNTALPVCFGLLLAPLAYLSASRGFDAVQLSPPAWKGLLTLGIGWSIALPLLCSAARRWSRLAIRPPFAGARP